jgi:hypothetical protein
LLLYCRNLICPARRPTYIRKPTGIDSYQIRPSHTWSAQPNIVCNFDHNWRKAGQTMPCKASYFGWPSCQVKSPPGLRLPLIETLGELLIRSAQRRGRNELLAEDVDGISGSDTPIGLSESIHARRPTGPAGKLLRRPYKSRHDKPRNNHQVRPRAGSCDIRGWRGLLPPDRDRVRSAAASRR